MKTPTYALVIRAAAALAVALAGSSVAVPALAESGSPDPATASPAPSAGTGSEAEPAPDPTAPVEPAASPPEPGISDAGLAEAIRRDLGMTLAEFNAAGAQAKRAAEAAPSLRGLPGYVGIVLRDEKIVVEGAGVELQARVDELNQAGPAEFALEAPALKTSPLAAPTGPSATPADAPKPELVAGSAEQLFQAYLREVGPAGLQAVAYADGHFIIRTGGTNTAEAWTPAALAPGSLDPVAAPAPGKISPADFVSRYANVELEKGAPIKTEEDYFGGQGYVIDKMTICSAGFGAFDPAGLPLVLTAGHCADDGSAVHADVEPSTAAPAGGMSTPMPAVLDPLGAFGFSQFGGRDNSPITGAQSSPGNIGTDIAVIKDLRPGLKVQPSAMTWKTPDNPGQTSVKIIGTAAPYQGQAVCRSGRTTGWSCGEVAETGVYVVGGRTAAAGDLRAFKGFLSYDVQSSGGDSGGPWISGNFAVGTHSAGEPRGAAQNFAVATTLDDALGYIPGPVQLQLFLNKPELAGTPNAGTVAPGSLVRGRVPAAPASGVAAGSKVRLHRPNQDAVEIPVDQAGNWSFNAPSSEGSFQFTAETVNGYSRSGAVDFTLRVESGAGAAAAGQSAPAARPVARVPVMAPAPAPGLDAVSPALTQGQAPAVGSMPSAPATAEAPAATAAPGAPAATPTPAWSSTEALNPADAGRTPAAVQQPGTAAGSFLPLAGLAGGAMLLGAAVILGARIARRRGAR